MAASCCLESCSLLYHLGSGTEVPSSSASSHLQGIHPLGEEGGALEWSQPFLLSSLALFPFPHPSVLILHSLCTAHAVLQQSLTPGGPSDQDLWGLFCLPKGSQWVLWLLLHRTLSCSHLSPFFPPTPRLSLHACSPLPQRAGPPGTLMPGDFVRAAIYQNCHLRSHDSFKFNKENIVI